MKKVILILAFLLFGTFASAQTPTPTPTQSELDLKSLQYSGRAIGVMQKMNQILKAYLGTGKTLKGYDSDGTPLYVSQSASDKTKLKTAYLAGDTQLNNLRACIKTLVTGTDCTVPPLTNFDDR